jgi:murein L,D-transpeptidase YcbB/YkuD
LVADGFLAWAWDMRYSNPAWQTEGTITPKMTRNEANELLRAALAKDVRGLDPDTIPSFLGELAPRQPQYARLLETLERYRKVAAEGGWVKASPKGLRVGSTGEAVVELKRRLQQENYFSGAMDDQFGDDLKAAVEAYQEGHQAPVTGVTDEGFWTALKVPVEERIVKVELALQRWRESRVTDDDHYMFVNIPSFYAEAWRGGEIEYRFKVVVGNTDLGCDRKKRVIGRVNATPLFSDEIEAVILNPYWNVPDRIWKEEILPAAIKDPEYLERKGYVCAKGEGLECRELKQKTGKDNALGQIKFIFPNGYSVYMHDTPKKKYFDRPVRAYSHGCMRVHEPERLAEYLLKADEVWDEALFHKQLEGDLETSYRLKRKIPIHIEYYTVRVDEQGRAQFFGDVYGYDEERLSGEEKPAVRCTPPPDPEIPDPDAVPEELMKDLPPVPVSPSGSGAPPVEDGGAKGSSTAPALDPGVVVIPSGDGPSVERKLRRVPVDGATEGQGEQTLTRPSEEATPKKDAPSKVEPKRDSKKDPKRDKKKDKKKDSKKKKSKKK